MDQEELRNWFKRAKAETLSSSEVISFFAENADSDLERDDFVRCGLSGGDASDVCEQRIRSTSKSRGATFEDDCPNFRRDFKFWKRLQHQVNRLASPAPFIGMDTLLNKARTANYSPAKPYTVAGFCDWIYRLYSDKQPIYKSKSKYTHLVRDTPVRLKAALPSGWKLVFFDESDTNQPAYTISSLVIAGRNLTAKPDIVVCDENRHLYIIEQKHSRANIHSDPWPNLKSQLWAYSQIDEFRNYKNISLIGEVLSPDGMKTRATYRWEHPCPPLETEALKLFQGYKSSMEQRL